jgi:hypothetical protein
MNAYGGLSTGDSAREGREERKVDEDDQNMTS